MNLFDLVHFRKSILKLTQEQLAYKLGTSRGTIAKIEAGHQALSDSLMNKISKVFNVDLEKYKSYNQPIVKENKVDEGITKHESDWKRKFLELEKEHNELLKKYVACLEGRVESKSKIEHSNKHTNK